MKSIDFPALQLMRAGIEYSFEISVRDFKVRVRPLTNIEIISATSEAADAFEKLPESKRLSITASLLNAMYQLHYAARPDVDEVSAIPLSLLNLMNSEEVNHLWKQYCRVVDKVNPSFEKMSIKDLNEMVDSLKKNSDPLSILTDLSISNLIEVCQELLIKLKESHQVN